MSEIKRILVVSTLLRGHGGMETAVNHFVEGMKSRNISVRIIFLGKQKRGKHSFHWCEGLNYKVLLPSYPFNDFIRNQIETVRLRRIIESWEPDVTIALNNSALDRLATARSKIKNPFAIYSWIHFSLKILRRIKTITKADFHLAISSGIKEELISELNISPERIRTVWNPFIKTEFLIERDPTKLNFLFMGRLAEQKDPEKLIRSFSGIQGHWILHIIGDGGLKSNLCRLANELNISQKIIWHGWQKNPWEYVRDKIGKVTCLIMTSKNEGFPMVLVEALSHGVFCISTDCPTGPRDVITSNNGILVPLHDSQGVSQAIEYVIHNNLPTSEKVAESVEKFQLENYTDNVLDFLENTSNSFSSAKETAL